MSVLGLLSASGTAQFHAELTTDSPRPAGFYQPEDEAEELTALRAAVEQIFAAAGSGDSDSLGGALADLGAPVIPVLLELIIEGHSPVNVDESRPLSRQEEAALMQAITRQPLAAVRTHVRPLAEAPATERARLIGLRVMQTIAKSSDLPLLTALATLPETRILPRSLRGAFEATLREVVAAGDWSPARLATLYADTHPSLQVHMVRVLVKRGGLAAVDTLAACLGANPAADAQVLSALAGLAETVPHPLPKDVLGSVRPYLDVSDPLLLMTALDTTQRMQDADAIAPWIALLDHPNQGISRKALEALQLTTGQRIGANAVRWNAWYSEQESWWSKDAPLLLEFLGREQPGEVADILLELAGRKIFRHAIAGEVAYVLERNEEELVILACATLGHLRSWQPAPALVDLLDHGSFKIRVAAAQALRQITGQEFAHDQRLWKAWVDRSLSRQP